MKFSRDVSNNNTYDEIYQKAADMVSSKKTGMPHIMKHQTMRNNVQTKSPTNCYLHNLYYPFLGNVVLQLDQQFSGHAEAVMRAEFVTPSKCCFRQFL